MKNNSTISIKMSKYIHIGLCVRFTTIVSKIAKVKTTRMFSDAGIRNFGRSVL